MLNRRNFLAGTSILPFVARAWARPRGIPGVITPTGKAQIGGFDTNGTSFAFINFMKMANGQLPTSAFAFPGVLDANGYPNNSGATLATSINCIVTLPAVYGTGDYVLKWTGDGAFQFSSASNMTITAHTDCSILGSGSGVIAAISSSSGSSPRVVFHFAGGTPSAGFTASFRSGQPYTNMANLVLCRADQEALLDAGKIFNPDFLALLGTLNPKTLRLMNWCSVDALMSQFAYRAPTAAMSYRISRWEPTAWAGSVTYSGDAYSCSVPSGWGGLVEGAIVQGQFVSSNSANLLSVTATANNGSGDTRCTMASTASLSNGQIVGFSSNAGQTPGQGVQFGSGIYAVSIFSATQVDLIGCAFSSNHTGTISASTLNVGGSGAKLLSGAIGATANISAIAANTCSTCIYDSVRDAWVYWPHGMSDASENGQIPIEMQVALCNTLGVNLWTNFPFEYTDASVTALATYVRDNLSTGLKCYYEYSNEVWNTADTGTPKAWIRGQFLGFSSGSAYVEAYYGLRVRQVMGNITTVYGGQTNYRRVMAFQAFSQPSFNQTKKFNGGPLVTGNAKYNAFTGSTSYNAFPNRPIDFCDTMAYATYFSGAVLTNGDYEATGTYTGMTGAADDYASLDPTRQAAALSWVDTDLRSGTSTIPGFTKQTIAALNSTANIGSGAIGVYPSWEASAALYDGARPSGVANLTIENYEGGNESTAPTTAQCTTIGISTTYGGTTGTVNVLLTAYKNSSLFQQLVIDQYTQMQAASPAPRVTTPSWFALQGASKWSQLTGDTYTGPTSLGPLFTGTPFKSWDGTVAYNH